MGTGYRRKKIAEWVVIASLIYAEGFRVSNTTGSLVSDFLRFEMNE